MRLAPTGQFVRCEAEEPELDGSGVVVEHVHQRNLDPTHRLHRLRVDGGLRHLLQSSRGDDAVPLPVRGVVHGERHRRATVDEHRLLPLRVDREPEVERLLLRVSYP
jgi:hypothetical protein